MIDHLGHTLLAFFWQGALIACIYAILRAAARGARPNLRYLLACATLAMMLAAPVVTWYRLAPPLVQSHGRNVNAKPNVSANAATNVYLTTGLPAPPSSYLPYIVTAWFTGASALSLRLLISCLLALRLRRTRIRPAPAEWQLALDRLRARLRLARPVRLLISAAADVPAVIGWLRPIVLVPVGAISGIPAGQLEALLLHELAHIRRHDYLVNILQSIAEALLFYHPAVWWISAHIRAEREHCCDDLAVAATGDPLGYARALAGLESARRLHFAPALAATGAPLASRIARLLGYPRPASSAAPAAIAGALALIAAALFAQSPAPKFEVASVKPSSENRFMDVRPQPGGRLTATGPLKLFIQNAYSLQAYQILGGPAWIESDRFQIDAKAPGNPDRQQLLRMLQSLLEERFQLQTHHESRDLPVYLLVASRSGPKLAAPKAGSCVSPAPGPDVPPPPRPGQPAAFPCGHMGIMLQPSGARAEGGQIEIAELVRILSIIMGRPVQDRTGITSTFDVHLEFTPDTLAAGLPSPMGPAAAAPPSDSAAPSILTTIQEQLGLKLESAKGPVDVLVIDHVARPTPN